MKLFFVLFFLAVGFCSTLHAQVPQSFNYQAIARDKDLKPIKGTFEVEARILQNGNTVFSETHANVQASETGLVLFRIGSINPTDFANINWAAGNLTLKINLDGPVDIDVPAAPIVAVPYAIMANDVAQKQTLTLNGNQLGITEGNTVTLPTGTGGTPTTLKIEGDGLNLTGTPAVGYTLKNTGDTNPQDDITTATNAQGDVSGKFPTLTVDRIKGSPVSNQAPQTGQVLQWDGSVWKPTQPASPGLSTVSATAPLIGTGTVNDPLKISGQNAQINQVLKWNGNAWVPADDVSAAAPAGVVKVGVTLTGDGSSTKPLELAQQNATTGQVLQWNGSIWTPADDQTLPGQAGGQIQGTFDNLSIRTNTINSSHIENGSIGILDLSDMGAADGNILRYDASKKEWTTVPLPVGPAYTAGAGIGITGSTIRNTGDTVATDDLTLFSNFSGDVTGTYNNLQLGNGVVGNNELANSAVTGAKIAQQGASNGQVLKWNGSTWLPSDDLNTVGSGTAATAAPLTGDGSASKPIGLTAGTANGQVLRWNGTQWLPATLPTYTSGTGININTQNQIENTGDTDATNDLTLISTFSGDVTGTYNNLQLSTGVVGTNELANNAVTGTKIAQQGASNGQVLKWNGTTWLPSDDLNTVGSGTAATAAPLTGDGSAGKPIGLTAGTANGQVLRWNGTQWLPATLPTYTTGTGININAQNQIENTGDTDATNDLTLTSTFSGDVTGTYNNLQLSTGVVGNNELANNAVTGAKIAQQGASNGQVLKWTGTTWVPANDETGTGGGGQTNVAAGTGISVTGSPAAGYTINNIGDTNPGDDLTLSSSFGGDVTGTYNNLQLANGVVGNNELANNAVTGAKIAQQGATNGQVLKWDGSTWLPQNEGSIWVADANGIYYPNSGNGTARVNNSGGTKLVELGPANKLFPNQTTASTTGALGTFDQFLRAKTALWQVSGFPSHGALSVFGPNGAVNYPPVTIYAHPYRNGSGDMYLSNGTGTLNGIRVGTGVDTSDAGYFFLKSPSTAGTNNPNPVEMGVFPVNGNPNLSLNKGYIATGSTNGLGTIMGVSDENAGFLSIFGLNVSPIVSIGNLDGFSNNGYVGVSDNTGSNKAGMLVDQFGQGVVFADVKNFRIPHPKDTSQEIWYACIEGPEAAAYERGTATLKNGEAFIPFSEHFREVINPNTTTMVLTPLSSDTDGLAVVEKTPTGFKVRELRGGKGNFNFDWEVKGVRKGHEDFRPVKPRHTNISSFGHKDQINQKRKLTLPSRALPMPMLRQ